MAVQRSIPAITPFPMSKMARPRACPRAIASLMSRTATNGLLSITIPRRCRRRRNSSPSAPLPLPLRLLRLLGGLVRPLGHALPFGRELQPRLAVLVAQGAPGLVAAFLGLFQIVIGFTLRHARDCR